ncbi:unnamed protein product [Sphagnum tenellum]
MFFHNKRIRQHAKFEVARLWALSAHPEWEEPPRSLWKEARKAIQLRKQRNQQQTLKWVIVVISQTFLHRCRNHFRRQLSYSGTPDSSSGASVNDDILAQNSPPAAQQAEPTPGSSAPYTQVQSNKVVSNIELADLLITRGHCDHL